MFNPILTIHPNAVDCFCSCVKKPVLMKFKDTYRQQITLITLRYKGDMLPMEKINNNTHLFICRGKKIFCFVLICGQVLFRQFQAKIFFEKNVQIEYNDRRVCHIKIEWFFFFIFFCSHHSFLYIVENDVFHCEISQKTLYTSTKVTCHFQQNWTKAEIFLCVLCAGCL